MTSSRTTFRTTLQTKEAGKYPLIKLKSAIASDKINQLGVVCNGFRLVMMKITQVFPMRPKTVTNQPTIQNQFTDISVEILNRR